MITKFHCVDVQLFNPAIAFCHWQHMESLTLLKSELPALLLFISAESSKAINNGITVVAASSVKSFGWQGLLRKHGCYPCPIPLRRVNISKSATLVGSVEAAMKQTVAGVSRVSGILERKGFDLARKGVSLELLTIRTVVLKNKTVLASDLLTPVAVGRPRRNDKNPATVIFLDTLIESVCIYDFSFREWTDTLEDREMPQSGPFCCQTALRRPKVWLSSRVPTTTSSHKECGRNVDSLSEFSQTWELKRCLSV